MTPSKNIPASPATETALAIFFALLFFLSSADQFFATRLFGFNIRSGQPLLLAAALFASLSLAKEARQGSPLWAFHRKLLILWLPFFAAYGLAALCSPTVKMTFLKWGWAAFNIGLAAIVCLNAKWQGPLKRGFTWAVLSIAGLIWLEALAIYWFGVQPQPDPGSTTLQIHWGPLFIGYAQPSWIFQGTQFYRPNVFYYEPSYAGSALAFAFPLLMLMAVQKGKKGFLPFLSPAFVLGAVILCSSRSGILSAFFAIPCLLAYAFLKKRKEIMGPVLRTAAIALGLLILFSLSPLGFKYIEFINGPLGFDTVQRADTNLGDSSEGSRLRNMVECLGIWKDHPLLGMGVVPLQQGGNVTGLRQISLNTWLEIAIESGALGVLAFLFSLLATMRETLRLKRDDLIHPFLVAAWASHFLVSLHFTQTFPRLDYWLIFFVSVSLLVIPNTDKKNTLTTKYTKFTK